MYTFHITVIYA